MKKILRAFIYLWRDKKYHKFYLGAHKPKKENDKYICSSKIMLKEYYERPEDFKRRILKYGPKDKIRKLEIQLLNKRKNQWGKRYYNLCASFPLIKWTPKSIKSMVEKCKKLWTPERRKAAGERIKKYNAARKGKNYEEMYGIELAKKTKAKIGKASRIALTGKLHSDERKQAISLGKLKSPYRRAMDFDSLKKSSKSMKKHYSNGGVPPMLGKKHNEESKRKQSENHASKKLGWVSPVLGRHLSKEQKRHLSKKLKGRLSTRKGKTYEEFYGIEKAKEIKKKVSENSARPMKGKKHSEETKRKQSEIRKQWYEEGNQSQFVKGHTFSKGKNNYMWGKTHTPEARKKISEGHLIRNNSETIAGVILND